MLCEGWCDRQLKNVGTFAYCATCQLGLCDEVQCNFEVVADFFTNLSAESTVIGCLGR
jgi:hypothetical protein